MNQVIILKQIVQLTVDEFGRVSRSVASEVVINLSRQRALPLDVGATRVWIALRAIVPEGSAREYIE